MFEMPKLTVLPLEKVEVRAASDPVITLPDDEW